jgi:hypothetical protein
MIAGLADREESEVTKRPGDETPEPPGGRAAERLRMFEEARRPKPAARKKTTLPEVVKARTPRKKGRKRR